MPRLPALAAAACLAAALSLVACGDTEEKNDYVDSVNEVTSTLNSGLAEVSSQGTAVGSPEEAAKVFTDFSAQLDAASADLSEIEPPEEVTELHDRLVGQLDELSAEATNAADEIGAGGPAAVAGVAAGFIGEATRISAEADSTISEINSELQG